MAQPPRTLRLAFPQWQGGDVTGYALGAAILDLAVPTGEQLVLASVPVASPPRGRTGLLGSDEFNGTSSYEVVAAQVQQAVEIIAREEPDRILVVGGDCSVSIAPFAWLTSRHLDFGVVWLDAHPDMWALEHQPHANGRAASILSGQDASNFAEMLPATVPPDKIVWVGTRAEIVPQLVDLDHVWRNHIRVDQVESNPSTVVNRLRAKGVRQIAIHFDLDVLDAAEFQGVAVGEEGGMSWSGVAELFRVLDDEFDLVGLTVAEHIPEGLETLRRIVSETSLMTPRPTNR